MMNMTMASAAAATPPINTNEPISGFNVKVKTERGLTHGAPHTETS